LEPQNAGKFRYIESHLNFIKKLRDLYRLKIAPRNVIERENLPMVAASMGYGDSPAAGTSLYDDFMSKTREASQEICTLVENIEA